MKKIILGVKVPAQSPHTIEIQNTLLKYGGLIKTRLGLHNGGDDESKPFGILLLEMYGEEREIALFEADLLKHPEVEVQKMYFKI